MIKWTQGCTSLRHFLHLFSNKMSAATLGSWNVLGTAGSVCIHTVLLPNNHLLCVERPKETPYPPNPYTQGQTVVDINLYGDKDANGKPKPTWEVRPYPVNPFCGGHSMLPNGSILIVGGDQKTLPEYNLRDGTKGMRMYNPCTAPDCKAGSWTTLPDMEKGRWYPTVVTIADGSYVFSYIDS